MEANETKETKHGTDASEAWLDSLDRLVSIVGDNTKVPCERQGEGAPCITHFKVSWGRTLTPKEHSSLCDGCLCYWHLLAARNAFVDAVRP